MQTPKFPIILSTYDFYCMWFIKIDACNSVVHCPQLQGLIVWLISSKYDCMSQSFPETYFADWGNWIVSPMLFLVELWRNVQVWRKDTVMNCMLSWIAFFDIIPKLGPQPWSKGKADLVTWNRLVWKSIISMIKCMTFCNLCSVLSCLFQCRLFQCPLYMHSMKVHTLRRDCSMHRLSTSQIDLCISAFYHH